MAGEINDIYNSNKMRNVSRNETLNYKETISVNENKKAKEYTKADELPRLYTDLNSKVMEVKKKEKVQSTILLKTVVVAAVATAAVATDIITFTNVEVEEALVSAGHEEIFYEFELANYNDEEVTVKVYNDFTTREQTVKEHFFSGVAEHLKPNVTYTVVVECEGKKIYTKTVTTMEEEEYQNYSDEEDIDQIVEDDETGEEEPFISDDYPEEENGDEYPDDYPEEEPIEEDSEGDNGTTGVEPIG